ncbi:MAG: hypothetical protein WD972_02410 [Candidatus Andersenbacteria bacterium]
MRRLHSDVTNRKGIAGGALGGPPVSLPVRPAGTGASRCRLGAQSATGPATHQKQF